MADEGYNGWKNYETWAVALWIDNDQGTQETVRDMAREYKGNEHERYDLSHALKEWVEEQNPLAEEPSLFSDLLNTALGEVDWYELAENYLGEVE